MIYTSNGLARFRADPRFTDVDGKGQTVVVIDTGIDLRNPHPIFGGDKNRNGIADRVEIVVNNDGWRDWRDRYYGPPQTLQDSYGHGTWVSSIILALAPKVNIVGAKSQVSSITDNIVYWAISNKDKYNITGINFSQVNLDNTMDTFENPTNPERLFNYQSFRSAERFGINLVAAAGNFYSAFNNRPGLATPAAYPSTLPVMYSNGNGKTEATDLHPSTQRRYDAIAAPGYQIPMVGIGGRETRGIGSSFATAFTTGISTLLQGVAQKYLGRELTPKELSKVIRETADPLGTSGYKEIDIYEAAEEIWSQGTGEPVEPGIENPLPEIDTTVSISINANNVSRYHYWFSSQPPLSFRWDRVGITNNSVALKKDNTGVKIDTIAPITIKEDTILSFSFKNNNTRVPKEVTGIGFDNNSVLYDNRGLHNGKAPFFSIESPNIDFWNSTLIDDYQYSGTGEWKRFNIPVGEYLTGTFDYLTVLNGIGTAQFQNIQLHNL
jgi:hypothetical protein